MVASHILVNQISVYLAFPLFSVGRMVEVVFEESSSPSFNFNSSVKVQQRKNIRTWNGVWLEVNLSTFRHRYICCSITPFPDAGEAWRQSILVEWRSGLAELCAKIQVVSKNGLPAPK
jgi:hypothetical protein